MCAGWMEREKKSHSVVSSPLSASSGVKHRLRCWVWLFLMLAVFKACGLRALLLPDVSGLTFLCCNTFNSVLYNSSAVAFAIGSCSEMTHT